jgi:hypothetical protein
VPADAAGMRHIKDAQKRVDEGNGHGALQILDDILGLAPRNSEALRLKAEILDAWGRFDDSLRTLHQLSQVRGLEEKEIRVLETRAMEEKESMVFSELSSEGRWYFAFPMAQVWISLMGFLGCAGFLLLSPELLSETHDRFAEMAASFCLLVLTPWIALLVVHCTGIKKVLVGLGGLRVCRRFSDQFFSWRSVASAVVEYDEDPKRQHLKLFLYGVDRSKQPILGLDLSPKNPVVKARRHFLRNVLSNVDVVVFLPRTTHKVGQWTPQHSEAVLDSNRPPEQTTQQNTNTVA